MKTINGIKLKKLLISAANNLYNHYPEIDALNVFPVPDGDTGTNMNLTLSSGATEIENRNDDSVATISKAFSRGLLMGARGNSGVITSQIFRGFASALEGKTEINAIELAEAFDNGRKISYKAVIRPIEGTILTVIRESSSALMSQVNEKTSIEDALKIILNEAKSSLNRTPNLLPVLKEVGVVDSGGAGLVRILEGMYLAAKSSFINKKEASAIANPLTSSLEEGYTISFDLVLTNDESKKIYQEARFKSFIEETCTINEYKEKNNVLSFKGSTINPANVIAFAQQYGDFIYINVENSKRELLEEKAKSAKENIKKNEDSKPVFDKEYAIIATSSGDGISEYFKEIGVDYFVSGGQTMNPSTEDFLKIIKETHAKVCYILPNNGNIVMAAQQCKDILEGQVEIEVIPSKTINQGLVAAMAFIPDLDKEQNVKFMLDALKTVKSGQVTYSIKDSVINGVHVNKNEFLAIKESKDIISSHASKFDALNSLLKSLIDKESSIITILLGEDISASEEEMLSKSISEKYKDCDVDIRRGNQPIYSFLVGIE